MKTIEEANGQKVWAVDATHGCDGCMFKDNPITNTCFQCYGERPDKRNVIFLPYSEEELKENTFTLSQINEVIDEMIMKRNIQSDLGVKEYIKALKELQLKLEKL